MEKNLVHHLLSEFLNDEEFDSLYLICTLSIKTIYGKHFPPYRKQEALDALEIVKRLFGEGDSIC